MVARRVDTKPAEAIPRRPHIALVLAKIKQNTDPNRKFLCYGRASLAIKVVVPETGSDKADALFEQWASEEIQLIAPVFFEVETDSILRQKVSLRRELTADQAERAFASLRVLPIKTRHSAEQRERAWEIAREFQFPTVYDATYLALAELSKCEFWTADEKLFKQVSDKLTFVQWVGNYSPVS